MQGKKLVYVVSDSGSRDKIIAYNWYAKHFCAKGYRVSFIILKGNKYLRDYLKQINIPFIYLDYSGKNKWELLKTIWQCWIYFMKARPHIVHSHYFDANFIALTAARLAFIRKRIYTRHHGTWNHKHSPKGVKLDKYISRQATDIIAVSAIVKSFMTSLEKVDAAKIHLVHHGFDFAEIDSVNENEIAAVRTKHSIPSGKFIIGVISTYQKLKGINYIIEAFRKFNAAHPQSFIVFANAQGGDAAQYKAMLGTLPPDSYCEILYENDVFALFKTFHVFVHVPIEPDVEAFGQVYVEALAAGIPSVFTMSGIAPEFIRHEYNALVVDFKNAEQICNAMETLRNNNMLRNTLIANGIRDAHKLFSIEQMIDGMERVYI